MRYSTNTHKHWDVISNIIKCFNYTSMIEIGLGSGKNARKVLDKVTRKCQSFRFFGIDPYTPYSNYNNDINATASRLAWNKPQMEIELSSYIEAGNVSLIETWAHLAGHKFEDESIDLVFIDGNHAYKYVKLDIDVYWCKISPGGVMMGHDYGDRAFPGVKKAFDKFIDANKNVEVEVINNIMILYKPNKK